LAPLILGEMKRYPDVAGALRNSSLRLGNNIPRRIWQWVRIGALCAAIHAMPGAAAAAETLPSKLDQVLERGHLICGVSRSGIGLSELSKSGMWEGFFVDFCRVLASALFGDKEAVEYMEVNDGNRFDTLSGGVIDVLMANTTWTVVRDSALKLAFTATVYYDGQGFLAYRKLGAKTLAEVGKGKVCVSRNTTTILNLQDLVARRKPGLEIVAFGSLETLYAAFLKRRCDMLTYDRVVLAAQKRYRAPNPDELVLYPEIISKEPLGPVVRQGEPRWFDVVQWSIFATIAAEELGLTSRNTVERMMRDNTAEAKRFLGMQGEIGPKLGLSKDWAYDIVTQVGNYGQIFTRHLGDVARGPNALWTDGGLMYAPPFR
jgi:general L-amino acid transport system substrate-binding protein